MMMMMMTLDVWLLSTWRVVCFRFLRGKLLYFISGKRGLITIVRSCANFLVMPLHRRLRAVSHSVRITPMNAALYYINSCCIRGEKDPIIIKSYIFLIFDLSVLFCVLVCVLVKFSGTLSYRIYFVLFVVHRLYWVAR